ncbi:unnamed protein product [Caenorhabditis angaria]|uniref:Uncharacterized protein n=1 Tax=Caenorhabditis angaria TaxID=860376 RepID=A0A9P1N9Y1_9PELO|nr:unnamed protein product [Caenorhabditis angaria]
MEINTKDRELRNLRSENTRLRTHIRNIEENKQVDLAIKRQREQESNVYNHMAEIDLRNGLLAANKELENLRREYVNRLNHFKQDMNAKNAEIMDLHRTIANGRILIKNIESRLETATKDLDKKTREVF